MRAGASRLWIFTALIALAGCQCGERIRSTQAQIEVKPASLDFGPHATGAVAEKTFEVSNIGSTALTVYGHLLEGDLRNAFAVTGMPEKIESGASVTVTVTYTAPLVEGPDGASLLIESDAANAPDSRVALSARSVASCAPAEAKCAGTCVDTQTDSDHCGACGSACEANEACQGGACVCVPKTCGVESLSCGEWPDGCGGTFQCGTCENGQECSATGSCTCPGNETTETSCTDGADNDCDGQLDCADAECASEAACAACTPKSCTELSKSCGTWSDGCSATLNCGTCSGNQTCDSLGACGCGQGEKLCGAQCIPVGDCCTSADCNTGEACSAGVCTAIPTTCLPGTEQRLTTDAVDSVSPALVWADSEWGVLWRSSSSQFGTDTYEFARVDTAGAIVSGPTPMTPGMGAAHHPNLSWSGAAYAFAWSDVSNLPSNHSNDVYLGMISSAGARSGSNIGVATGPALAFPATATWNGTTSEYGVFWADAVDVSNDTELYFAAYDSSGARTRGPTRLTTAAGYADFADAAWNGTHYGVAFADSRSGTFQLYFMLVNPDGTVAVAETLVNQGVASASFPSLVWTGTEFGLAWSDSRHGSSEIYFARYSGTGQLLGQQVRVTSTQATAGGPSLAWTGTDFGLAFHDMRTGARRVYFRKLSSVGALVGTEENASCDAASTLTPSLAWSGTKLALAWADARHGAYELYFRSW